jgi:hypothetical protein
MKLKTLSVLALQIGFAGFLAVAQTAPPAGQTASPAAAPAKPAAPKPVVKKPASPVDIVIQMVKSGMSEPFIIKNYIQKNNKPIDLTPADMLRLKEAGVSENLMSVMMDPSLASAPAPAPVPDPVVAAPPPPPPAPDPVPAPAPDPVPPPAPAPKTVAKAKAPVAPGDWKGALSSRIEDLYPLSGASGDNSDIETPGAILQLKKSGLTMSMPGAFVNTNTYKNGSITHGLLGGLCTAAKDGSCRTFVRGEKFWLTAIDVKDDGLVLRFLSDPLPEVRYQGALKFPWDKKTQPNADEIVAQVAQVIQNVGVPAPAAPAAPQQMAPIPPPPPAPAMDTIPAPAAPAPQIQTGMTKEQITAALGQPVKVANVGTKQILYFSNNLKVTLVAGKVTAIE